MKTYFNFLQLIIFCSCYLGFSQELPNIIPSPPEVASLIKYADVPVNIYNGTSNYSIPIYDISEGDLKFSLALSYYSNGLKVTEESGLVGLGWSINGLGVIHMSKGSDINDRLSDPPIPYYLTTTDYLDTNQYNNLGMGCRFRNSEAEIVDYGTEIIGSENVYDLYMYNFGGYSGKFIIPEPNEFVDLSRNNIKFISQGQGFKAITPDGTQYFFEIVGETITPNIGDPCNYSAGGYYDYNYSYYLNKIISPYGRIMNFSYKTPFTTQSIPTLSQSQTKSIMTTQSNGGYNNSKKTYSTSFSYHDNILVDEITTDNVKIKFLTSSGRYDIDNAHQLDHIAIYKNGETQPIKVAKFTYGYFSGSSSYGDWLSMSTNDLGECGNQAQQVSTNNKQLRLKLQSVQFTDEIRAYNYSGHPKYSFEYDTTSLPYKTSLAQDLWGYFNGVTNNPSLIPDYNDIGYFDLNIPYAFVNNNYNGDSNRKSSQTHLKAAMLTKINLPTGGYTTIDYEVNTFDDLPGTSQQIKETMQFVTDIGTGTVEKTFYIPDIGYHHPVTGQNINPGSIGFAVYCNGVTACDDHANMNACPGFAATYPEAALYTLLQKQNSNGSWTTEVFDKNTYPTNNPCGGGTTRNFTPGWYKIIANYPDNLPPGAYGHAMATINVTYKDITTETFDNIGGGLRIKSTAHYSDVGEKYDEKTYNYSLGRMMTKPIFYSNFNLENATSAALDALSGASCSFASLPPSGTCYPGILHEQNTLHSTPVTPYSFNASGAAVGYDMVTVNYGINGKNGQEILKFKNRPDIIYSGSMIPGVTGARALDNGMLEEKTVKKNITPSASTPTFKTILSEMNSYEIKSFKDYWAYKSKYMPKEYMCSGNVTPTVGIDSKYNFLHFYPVKAGKVVLTQKVVTNFDEITESPTLITTSSYEYNSINQLQEEKVTTSNDNFSKKTVYKYPADLLSNPDHPHMSYLFYNNILNPIINTQNFLVDDNNSIDKKLSETKTKYFSTYVNGNTMVLPQYIYSNKGESNIDESQDLKIIFEEYDDKGNIIEYKKAEGTAISFIWGYNQQYPVAKIENATQSQINSLNLNNSLINNLNTSISAMQNELQKIRDGIPDAMVTTYTYKPLIGITSVTDPKGLVVYYYYDDLNRLDHITDHNGNILSENEYNYKP